MREVGQNNLDESIEAPDVFIAILLVYRRFQREFAEDVSDGCLMHKGKRTFYFLFLFFLLFTFYMYVLNLNARLQIIFHNVIFIYTKTNICILICTRCFGEKRKPII